MERASALNLSRGRAAATGREFGPAEMMQAINQLLTNTVALGVLAGLGALQQGLSKVERQIPAAQAIALAKGVVASIFTKQNRIEKEGVENTYSPPLSMRCNNPG